jgi:hypothetical protein
MAKQNNISKELQNLLGGSKNLDPIEQTVFETGPQAGFTPPEVANVYQEGQVQFAQQQIGIDNADIYWYNLGQNAFQMASQTFETALDYLIDSKRNGVVELKDKYQSTLDDFYLQQSTEIYNADKEKRPANSKVINDLVTQIKQTKEDFRTDAIKVLGDEKYFAEDLDVTKLGLKYQELALSSRNSLRDIDRFANKLLYETQRVINGVVKEEENFAAWKNGSGVRDAKIQPQVFLGAFPLPPNQENPSIPDIGFEKDMAGNWTQITTVDPVTGEVNSPVIKRADGKWYFQPQYIDSLKSIEDFEKLINYDNFGYGPYSAVMNATGQPTADIERLIKDTVETEQPNIGTATYVSTLLANVPDHLAENAIDRIDGLDEGQKLKLSMMRLHVKNKFDPAQLGQITGLKRDALKDTFKRIQQLRAGTTIFNASQNPQDVVKFEELVGVTYSVLKKFGADIEEGSLELTAKAGNLIDETPNISASSLLAENPALVPILARVSATLESNPGLFGADSEARKTAIETLLDEQVRREGYIVTNNPNTGMPLILYAPNMSYMENIKASLDKSPMLAGLPKEKKELLKDPVEKDKALIKAHMFGNNWLNTMTADRDFKSSALNFAKQINPQVDTEVFEALLDGAVNTTRDKNGVRIQTSITGFDLLRFTIASSPTAMEKRTSKGKNGIVFAEGYTPAFEARLVAAKQVFDDLPITSSTGAIPWFDASFNYSQTMYNFMGTPRGGRPIKITKLTGASGTDYIEVITPKGSRQLGAITPMTADGTPLLYIPQESDASGGDRLSLEKGMSKYLEAERGIYPYTFVPFDSESAPNFGPMEADQVIYAVNEPYLPTRSAILANVNSPLTTFEDAKAFFAQNNTAFHDIVMSDSQLKKSKNLAWEIARDADGTQTYDENKALFTDANLKQLFDKAVANGAKTNVEFLGYVFNAMRVYQDNSQVDFGRNTNMERATKSSSTDFVVQRGDNKGLVLYSPNSEKFITGVETNLANGLNLYYKSGKYYMLRPEESNKDYRLIIDSATAADSSELTGLKAKQKKAKAAKSIFYTQPIPNISTEALENLAKPSTISQEKLATFQQDFMKYAYSKDLINNPDFRYINWTQLYTDTGSFPDNPEEIPSEYFLPGHSSTLPLRARIAIQGRDQGYIGQGIEETIKERTPSSPNVMPELAAAPTVIAGTEGFVRGVYSSFVDTNKRDIEIFRENNIDADPQDWLNSLFGTDELSVIRRSTGRTVWNIPEQTFNVVHYIKSSNNPYNAESSFGLSEQSWKTIQDSPLTKPELEYQLRVIAGKQPNNTQTIRKNNGALDWNKPTKEEAAKTMNEVIGQLNPNEFTLDELREIKLKDEILQAYSLRNVKITNTDGILEAIKDPSKLVNIKRKYFQMTLYPDGYMSKTNRSTKQTRIEAIAAMLQL